MDRKSHTQTKQYKKEILPTSILKCNKNYAIDNKLLNKYKTCAEQTVSQN